MKKNELRKLTQDAVEKANNRLSKLEKNGYDKSSSAYRYIEKQDYKGDKALKRTRTDKMRFKTDLRKMTYNQLSHLYTMASGFNEAKTSTKTGIEKLVSASYAKSPLKETMTKQEYAEYWQDSNVQNFSKLYGSDYVQKLATKTENAEEVAKRVMDYYNETQKKMSLIDIDKEIENMKKSTNEEKEEKEEEKNGNSFSDINNENPFSKR